MLSPTARQVKEMKIHKDTLITVVHKDIKPKHLIIATHPLYDFSIPREKSERDYFLYISTIYQRNPTNVFLRWRLANFYFEGYGTKVNIKRAKILYKKLHQKKYDVGTFGLLACMKKENVLLQSRYETCLERTDTNHGKILYRIGKGQY
jgi:hypothetical protein